MGADYAGAIWMPCTNFWSGTSGAIGGKKWLVVIHGTAAGHAETPQQLAQSSLFNGGDSKGRQASVQYINGRDGTVVQAVSEKDAAWGNCCVTGLPAPPGVLPKPGEGLYHDSFLVAGHNYNPDTISIENEKWDTTNDEPLTEVQYASLVSLVRDICKRNNIPMKRATGLDGGIIGHFDLDPKNKAHCPGTFDWDRFFNDLKGGSVALVTNNGAVLDLVRSFQLDSGSQDKCGPWSVSELKYAGLPGKGPRGGAGNVGLWASAEYVRWIGPDVISDEMGSSIDNMHSFLADAIEDFGPTPGMHRLLHWTDIAALSPTSKQADDLARVRRALGAGYPVLVTVNEQSVISKRLGKCPYSWQPALGPVNHIFTIVGVDPNGDFIVDDQLNNVEPWPMVYLASSIEMHWASIVQVVGPDPTHPWLAPIPGPDPLSWPAGFNAQLFAQGGSMPVPSGWKDDGTTLTAPNGLYVRYGFRNHVINASPAWESFDWPLQPEVARNPVEESNPSLGAGSRQVFRKHLLEYTPAKGVFEGFLGQEFMYVMSDRDAKAKALSEAQAKVADLQAQLAKLQAAPPPAASVPSNLADIKAQLDSVISTLQAADVALSSDLPKG